MGGGLLQLVAYGAQDAYLSGNPQITFWRGLFKRHTNFAMEPFRVNMTGQATWGTKHSAILTRYADLVSSGYIEVQLPAQPGVQLTYSGLGRIGGFNLVKYVELDIGGQIIDRQYGEFMYLWSTLAYSVDARAKMDVMASVSLSNNGQCDSVTGRPFRQNLTYIPLMFFFCRNPGAALPLIALQYHEVKINILWNDIKLIFAPNQGGPNPLSYSALSTGPAQANLVLDYIYLDVEERRRMAQESHEYLIEQTQFNEDKGLTAAQNRLDLTFNHPVKELIWVTQYSWRRDCRITPPATGSTPPELGKTSPLTYDALIYDCALQLNGQDRMQALPGDYFAAVQPFQHHSGTTFVDGSAPSNSIVGSINDSGTLLDVYGVATQAGTITTTGSSTMPPSGGVYCYSFAIKPEEHQPSGTCNFSRIDTATLVFSVDGKKPISAADQYNADIRVYAINYNILRVMSGMGGLAYSN
jgi:hypothetical protein